MTVIREQHALGWIDTVDRPETAALSREVPLTLAAIQSAWPEFEATFDSLRGRAMLGLIMPATDTYRLATARLERDSVIPAGLDASVIPGGSYLRLRLRGEPHAVYDRIGDAFEVLFARAAHDASRPHIEYYRREGEVDCLVPIRDPA